MHTIKTKQRKHDKKTDATSDQLEVVDIGDSCSDLKRYTESIMQDMDFWSHSLVKTKLGILKSKIKKVDFIYNDFLPDGRLDPTPRGAHNRESMGQR